MASRQTEASVASATGSLKALVTIISGLAATNGVVRLLTETQENGAYGVKAPSLQSTLLFVVTIATIGRFYHGNMRHLDEEYAGRFGRAFIRTGGRRAPGTVAADFLIIFIEALILSVLSYFFSGPPERFFGALAGLLLLDAIWFFFANRVKTDSQQSISWAANNLFFGVVLLGGVFWLSTRVSEDQTTQLYWTIGLTAAAVVNIAFDITQEFQLYFPNPNPPIRRVFVAAPFTAVLGERANIPVEQFRIQMVAFIEELRRLRGRKNHYHVFLSHEREKWGDDLYGPERALTEDLDELDQADIVVSFLTEYDSPGVQMELGYALARNIPVVQIRHSTDGRPIFVPYLNRAFKDPEVREEHRVFVAEGSAPSEWVRQVDAIIATLDEPKRRS